MKVPCVNSGYGCCQELTRGKMAQHLPNCCASVISVNKNDVKRSDYFWYAKNYLEDLGSMDPINSGESCPYAFAGCTFTFRQFIPMGNKELVYSDWLGSIGVAVSDTNPAVNVAGWNESHVTKGNVSETKGDSSQGQSVEVQGDSSQGQSVKTHGEASSNTVDAVSLSRRLQELSTSDGDEFGAKQQQVPDCRSLNTFSRQSSVNLCRSLSQDGQTLYTGLLRLPYEILQKIAAFLDCFSLCNLSVTCTFLREICSLVLVDKGMVSPVWTQVDCDDDGRQTTNWTTPDGSVKTSRWAVKHMVSL